MSTPTRTMKYTRLGNSGLKVSRLILGCMSYGTPEWQEWVLAEEESLKHIKFAYDNGINAFDTANVYSNGVSEEILGKAIKKFNLPRDEIVVMTKVCGAVGRKRSDQLYGSDLDSMGYVNQYGLSRKHIFDSVDHSLRRLDLDYIDVLQCHRFDDATPIEEIMQALHDVVKSGKVRYIGMSSCYAWQFSAMQNYALNKGLTPFISMQNFHALVYREEEREMMPTLKHFGVASIPWSPLARGILTHPWGSKDTKRSTTDIWRTMVGGLENSKIIVDRVEEIAKKKNISMAQVAVAWSLTRVAAPIVGSTSINNLQDLFDGVNVELSEEEIKYLEEPYKPLPIFGH